MIDLQGSNVLLGTLDKMSVQFLIDTIHLDKNGTPQSLKRVWMNLKEKLFSFSQHYGKQLLLDDS